MTDTFGNQLNEKDLVLLALSNRLVPGVVIYTCKDPTRIDTIQIKYASATRKKRMVGGVRETTVKYMLKVMELSNANFFNVIKIHPAQLSTFKLTNPWWAYHAPQNTEKSLELLYELYGLMN